MPTANSKWQARFIDATDIAGDPSHAMSLLFVSELGVNSQGGIVAYAA
ncbi:MAG: hypothetical protein L0Z50_29920 [Verrucomicrobiales bacterium]|nr:hypothetical protein [Verrucomicrobiales bacterium]